MTNAPFKITSFEPLFEAACERLGFTAQDIRGQKYTGGQKRARHLFAGFFFHEYGLSLESIGEIMGRHPERIRKYLYELDTELSEREGRRDYLKIKETFKPDA